MIKLSYITQMTYDVSDTEKAQAGKALLFFAHSNKLLDVASNHLDLMKTPFKDNPDISSNDILEARSVIRKFRDKSIDNFNLFKECAFKCVHLMKEFSSDTQTLKLMKSFISSVDKLELKVNEFCELFNDLESKEFSQNIVKFIEVIQTQCDSVEEIINERIKTHIQSNILATSWVDAISNDLQMQVQKKTPLILDLFNQRQDQLNDAIKERTSQSGE